MISERQSHRAALASSLPSVLISTLLEGMHAAAQPLTILQACLNKEHTRSMSEYELRKLTVQSANEVERLCSLFSYMQQLITIEASKSKILPEQITALLSHVIEGIELIFKESGMHLLCAMPISCPDILIDGCRTRQALSSVLQVVHSISSISDTIEIVPTCSSEMVSVTVTNLQSFVPTLKTEALFHLALAEANIRSQDGRFTWRLQPFSAEIELFRPSLAY